MTTQRRARQLGAGALACALALSMTACSGSGGAGGSGGKAIVWTTWGSPDELTSFNEFEEQFKADHSDISVTFQPVPSYEEYHSKLTTQLSSGTAPDVFYVGDDKIASLVANDVLMPLDEYLEKSDILDKADFDEAIYRIAEKDGSLFALPNDVNPDVFWYDKEALQAAGISEDPAELAENDEWTTEKFAEMNKKLTDAGLHGAMFWNYWNTHDSWITSQGGKVYDDDGNYVAHEDDTSVKAMTDFAKHMQDSTFEVADTLPKGAGADSLFVTHKLGFFAQGRYTIGTLEGAGVNMDSYDIVRWPTPDGKAAPTGVAASYLAINKNAQDPDAAFLFFSEFLSKDGQELRLKGAGNAVPSVKGADDIVTGEGFPAHAETMLHMRDMGYSNFPAEAVVPDLSNQIAVDYMLPLYQGKSTAPETLKAIADLVAKSTEK